MAFKFIAFAACLAFANAGNLLAPAVHYSPASAVSSAYISQPLAAVHAAPAVHATYAAPVAHATYAAAPVAIHAPAVGATHQSVLRSLGGNQAVSHYSKAVDSAFSTVRKYDTRITNDAVSIGHAPAYQTYAAPAYQTYAAPAVHSYASAPVVAKTYAAPAYHSYSAPAYQTYAAPAVHSYASAPVVAKTYAAPAYQSYAAPAYQSYAHAPVATYAAAAPVVKSVNYSPAVAVAHTTFQGLGAQYAW